MRRGNRALDMRRRRIDHELVARRGTHRGGLRRGPLLRDGFGRGCRARSRMMRMCRRVDLAGRMPLRHGVPLGVRRLAGFRNIARGTRMRGTRRACRASGRVRRRSTMRSARVGCVRPMRLLRSCRSLHACLPSSPAPMPTPARQKPLPRPSIRLPAPRLSPNAVSMSGEDYTESKLAIIHIWTNIY